MHWARRCLRPARKEALDVAMTETSKRNIYAQGHSHWTRRCLRPAIKEALDAAMPETSKRNIDAQENMHWTRRCLRPAKKEALDAAMPETSKRNLDAAKPASPKRKGGGTKQQTKPVLHDKQTNVNDAPSALIRGRWQCDATVGSV